MEYRMMVTYTEIGCFVSCLCGWMLVCSTLPTPYWSYSENSESVMTSASFYNNLWQDCLSDNTGASACKGYPSMMNMSAFIHACRALTICAVILGFFGSVLTLIGMKCTKLGGSDISNARVTFSAGITYMVSGFCGMITYSWWGNRTRAEFVDPQFMGSKYEFGAALFIGWGGSILLILGGAVLTYFSGKEGLPSRSQKGGTGSYTTARSGRFYKLPASSSRVTLVSPMLYEGRQSRTTKGTAKTAQTDTIDNFV